MSEQHDPIDDVPAGARALARLNASRQRLRQELLPEADDDPAANDSHGGLPLPRKLKAMFRHWRFKLRHMPVAGMALGALQTWWHQHPLRMPGEALGSELRHSVVPLVRKHPVATVLVASAAGAALVAWRPWRWPVVARQIKPIPRSFGRWIVGQLAQPAVQSMLAAWMMSSVHRSSAAAAAQDEMPLDDDVRPDPTSAPDMSSSAPAAAATAPSEPAELRPPAAAQTAPLAQALHPSPPTPPKLVAEAESSIAASA